MEILLGIGGSADSQLALRETLARVAGTDDRLTVAILELAGNESTVADLEALVRETAAAHEVEVDIEVIHEDPGPALTAMAASGGFDRLVIGGGTQSPMGKITLGDITEFVVLNADTTVTLVR